MTPMALSLSARLGLTRWGAQTDPLRRAQLDADNAALDANAAMYAQGTFNARPAFGKAGRFYYATDTGLAYYDTGAAWTPIIPGRLDAASIGQDVDYNATIASGWYVINQGSPNAPVATGAHYLEVRALSTTYVEQVARAVTTGVTYRRTMQNSVWQAWVPDVEDFVAVPAYGNTTSTGTKMFRRRRMVTLCFEAAPTIALNTASIWLILPVGYRPPQRVFFIAPAAGNQYLMRLDPNGNISCGTHNAVAGTTAYGYATYAV